MKTFVSFFCHSRLSAFLLAEMFKSGIFTVLFASALYAQSTDIKLTTEADNSSNLRVLNSTDITRLQVNSDGGLYVGGAYSTGVIPKEGTGTRLIWYPRKAAFRAGHADDTQWDDANIGDFSIALGYNSTASGSGATAMGIGSIASGNYSTASGYNTIASAYYATAIGNTDTASGSSSVAMGDHSTASSDGSVALGYYAKARGALSTAIGPNAVATNFASSSFGNTTISSGSCATAMGNYVSTNNNQGAFIIGDYSTGTTITNSDTLNRMTMRFAGGYKLFTNSGCTLGAYLAHNATAWTVLCDRNKKENFHPIDGEQILTKIREMPITEWNYKETDPTVKYIGPVAQDFYSAFHLGGTDSLGINTLCIDGVNIAAIQALEKRTAELQKANEKIAEHENKIMILEKKIEELSSSISSSATNDSSLIKNNK